LSNRILSGFPDIAGLYLSTTTVAFGNGGLEWQQRTNDHGRRTLQGPILETTHRHLKKKTRCNCAFWPNARTTETEQAINIAPEKLEAVLVAQPDQFQWKSSLVNLF
jgi:hypothetical protein